MMRPTYWLYDQATGETIEREMTEDEYEALLASGWTEEEPVTK
jgi:hypothetical protein